MGIRYALWYGYIIHIHRMSHKSLGPLIENNWISLDVPVRIHSQLQQQEPQKKIILVFSAPHPVF